MCVMLICILPWVSGSLCMLDMQRENVRACVCVLGGGGEITPID